MIRITEGLFYKVSSVLRKYLFKDMNQLKSKVEIESKQ